MATDTTSAPPPESASHDGPSGPRAGFWRRFGAYLIDAILLGIPYGILIAIAPDAVGVIYVLWLILQIAYYVVLEGGPKGQTVGKMALGIRVYDLKQGGPIGYGRGFIRWIGRIPSGLLLLLGYFWMLWDKENQTWHDKFAGSVVVPTESYPVN